MPSITKTDDSSRYANQLVDVAPSVLWFDVQDVGDYSGDVYAIGRRGKEILVFEDYYGSCSGCGEWGLGKGGPQTEKEALDLCTRFRFPQKAIEYVRAKNWGYDKPDIDRMVAAINEAAGIRSVA